MSSPAASPATSSAVVPPATRPIIYLGLDVHKDSITIAVLPEAAKTPTRLDRLPNDLPKLKRWLDRVARDGELRACYEASGAGYVLHRALQEWGYACAVIAPSLIPTRPGVQRKHDKRDAADLARFYRAGELVVIRIPSEAEERVRDVVRCRATFQREILKSRHYLLKFLARRGFVFREGTIGARCICAGCSTSRPRARRSRHTIDWSTASITPCCCTSCSGATRSIARSNNSHCCRPSPRWCGACSAFAGSRCTRRWCSPRRSWTGAGLIIRANSPATSASFPGRTRAVPGRGSAPSRRRGTVTVATSWCRPRGATGIAPRPASISNDDKRTNPPP